MHKIIVSNFDIDLSDKKLSISEENSWFADNFFTKYSYPFELSITDEVSNVFGDILSEDSVSGIYKVDCKYVFHDKIENAILFVENISNKTASLSIQYGIDEFPNFEKKLAELNLFQTEVADIYVHANQVIEKKYPEVNYNFPMIHTEKYDSQDAVYFGFEKIINKRDGNLFVRNVVENNVMLNKNIIQPLPYLMYILKRGFELSGRILQGDILQDSILNKMLIFSEKEYVSRIENSGVEILINESSIDNTWEYIPKLGYSMQKTFVVTEPGYYNLIGEVNIGLSIHGFWTGLLGGVKIFINDNLYFYQPEVKEGSNGFLVDKFFDLQPGQTALIRIELQSAIFENVAAVDLQALPVYFYDDFGNKLTNLFNSNKLDLNRAVPDMTFGALFTTVMNWFNYDVDEITESTIVINKVNNSFKNNSIFDLSIFDNLNVQTKIEHDNNFHLKYQEDGDVDLGGVFLDSNQIVQTSKEFSKTVKNAIEINAFYLQNETIDGLRTAKSNQSSEDKFCVVLYDGMQSFTNVTSEPVELEINNVFYKYHYDWLQNRISGKSQTFTFTTSIENIIDLNTKKRVYAYNNIHLCKRIEKREIAPDIFEVEIETEKLVLK